MSILAFIDKTNTVTLVLNTDPTLVPSFTTSAHIVEITETAPNAQVGWTYDGTNFAAPIEPTVIVDTTETTSTVEPPA